MKSQEPAKTSFKLPCVSQYASEMSGQGGGREGGHGSGQSDRCFGSVGRRKGKSHAGPGRPTQSFYVATPKDGAGSRAIYEYCARVPKSQVPSLAGNNMEAAGQQDKSSVAATNRQLLRHIAGHIVSCCDDKSRFTVELAATGDGKMLPYFIVIKCSAPSGASANPYDLSGMRVIQNLHKEPFFSEREGWTLKKWEGFQSMKRKTGGKAVEHLEWVPHLRLYLQHRDSHVITCQPKAWMDAAGFAMYIDTVLGASVEGMLKGQVARDQVRVISGNVLTGSHIPRDGFLGLFDDQLTVIEQGNKPEFFGWLVPSYRRPSLSSN